MKYLILVFVLMFSMSVYSQYGYQKQRADCDKMIQYVKNKGFMSSKVNCSGSKWIVRVYFYQTMEGYAYGGDGAIVAYIRQNEYDSRGKPYIFCSVPSTNWRKFRRNIYDSWGKSFHRYIMPYKCDCY